MKTENLKLPVDLIEKLCKEAEKDNISVTDFLYKLLEEDNEKKNLEAEIAMDLFETPEKIPFDIQKILDRMNKRIDYAEDTYKLLADALTECEKKGYTFEYGLDGVPFNLKPI